MTDGAIEKLFDTFEQKVPMRKEAQGYTFRSSINCQTDEARLLIEARTELAELQADRERLNIVEAPDVTE